MLMQNGGVVNIMLKLTLNYDRARQQGRLENKRLNEDQEDSNKQNRSQ